MKKNTAILISLLFFFSKGNAQTHTTDSLQHVLSTAKEDTNKVKLLLALGDAWQFENNDFDKAKACYLQAGALSERIHFNSGILKYLSYYSDVLYQQGLLDSALAMAIDSKNLAAKVKDSAKLMQALFGIGVIYDELKSPLQGIRNVLQARDYYIRKKQMDKAGTCNNELMLLFLQAKQYEQAILYGKEAVALQKKYCAPYRAANPLQNLAVVYEKMIRYDKAAPLLEEALALSKKYHKINDEIIILVNLVDLYFHDNRLSDIKKLTDRILSLSKKMKNDENIYDWQLDMARLYLRQNQIEKAGIYADSALLVAKKMKSDELKRGAYAILSHIAYAAHQYSKALKYDEQIDLTQEVITDSAINRSLIEIQTKYETAKKETQIKQLQTQQALQQLSIQRKKTYLFITLCIIAALLIIGLLYYRNYRRKQKLLLTEQQLQQQKITTLEKEKQLLATEAVLQGQEEERSRLAKDLHDGLGGILSGAKYSLNNMKENMIITAENAAAFERTVAMLDQSISELRRVAHNMMPENLVNQSLGDALKDLCSQVSSGGKLQIDYHDFGMENFQPDNTIKVTVYRIVQELINNIMRHAQATTAIVQLIVKDSMLNLTVEDNGKGFDTAQLNNAEGIGYKNIQSRIAFLKGSIDLRSRSDDGTSVYVQIPV